MHDWAAPLIASALFAFLSPGLILQFPGKESPVGFMNMKTTVASIFVHTILYVSHPYLCICEKLPSNLSSIWGNMA
ncbi:hypothetical protein Bca4012_039679 [Brassica carinata]